MNRVVKVLITLVTVALLSACATAPGPQFSGVGKPTFSKSVETIVSGGMGTNDGFGRRTA